MGLESKGGLKSLYPAWWYVGMTVKVHDIETGSINMGNLAADSVRPSYIGAATADGLDWGALVVELLLEILLRDGLENKRGVVGSMVLLWRQ
jgi:hypothetical protein